MGNRSNDSYTSIQYFLRVVNIIVQQAHFNEWIDSESYYDWVATIVKRNYY